MTHRANSLHCPSLLNAALRHGARAAVAGLLLAVSGCATLIGNNPQQAQNHMRVAMGYFNDRQYGKAIEELQAAIKADPSMASAYNHLALVYLETRRYGKSLEAFNKALEVKPDYPEVLNNIGVLYNRQEKYRQAISYFKKALAFEAYLTPENAYTNMGYAYYKMGELDKALEAHHKAVDVAPMFCLANKNLGDVYAKKKNYKKAAQYFESSVTHCPLYQEGRYKLALVSMKLGKKKQARNHFERIIEHHREGPYVDRSQEVLKYLR